MLAHLGAHISLIKHKKNEFKDWISWTIIIGAGFMWAARFNSIKDL